MWYIYIIECNDGRLYTGMTNNVERRYKQHDSGTGARFTRIFGVKKLLYTEEHETRSQARVREIEVQNWPRAKKLQLVKGKLKPGICNRKLESSSADGLFLPKKAQP